MLPQSSRSLNRAIGPRDALQPARWSSSSRHSWREPRGLSYNAETPARHGQADSDKRGLLTAKSCFALGSKAELNLGLFARLPMPSGRQLVTLGWRHVREHPPGSLTTLWIWGRHSTCSRDFERAAFSHSMVKFLTKYDGERQPRGILSGSRRQG